METRNFVTKEEMILTFDQVCQEISGEPTSLLLGNGFSVAYNPTFDYDSLKDEVFKEAFGGMGVEEIMLRVSHTPDYLVDCLKKGFISAISTKHPHRQDDNTIASCAAFLKHFSKVYTLNYDLLLYWTINSDGELKRKFMDGFGFSKEGRPNGWPNAAGTTTFYMHGSLLLHCSKTPQGNNPCLQYPTECMLDKYKRPKTTASLIALAPLIQILNHFTRAGQYPHFVSEGESEKKYKQIQKCTYLKGCYDALKSESGILVTYGVSFKNDYHILNAIKESNVKFCYVGIYGNDADAEALLWKAKSLRSDSRKVKVYDTETAKVWQVN